MNFNEPTSILQRMVEDMLYVDILEKAATSSSSLEELAYLAVYSVSVYGTTAVSVRVGKPFNPLLGETYECDRRAELGWRVFLEQVCGVCVCVCGCVWVWMCVGGCGYLYAVYNIKLTVGV